MNKSGVIQIAKGKTYITPKMILLLKDQIIISHAIDLSGRATLSAHCLVTLTHHYSGLPDPSRLVADHHYASNQVTYPFVI